MDVPSQAMGDIVADVLQKMAGGVTVDASAEKMPVPRENGVGNFSVNSFANPRWG